MEPIRYSTAEMILGTYAQTAEMRRGIVGQKVALLIAPTEPEAKAA